MESINSEDLEPDSNASRSMIVMNPNNRNISHTAQNARDTFPESATQTIQARFDATNAQAYHNSNNSSLVTFQVPFINQPILYNGPPGATFDIQVTAQSNAERPVNDLDGGPEALQPSHQIVSYRLSLSLPTPVQSVDSRSGTRSTKSLDHSNSTSQSETEQPQQIDVHPKPTLPTRESLWQIKPFTSPVFFKSSQGWERTYMLFDTGSDTNLIPQSFVSKLGFEKRIVEINPNQGNEIMSLSNNPIHVIGTVELCWSRKENSHNPRKTTFYVAFENSDAISGPILGAVDISKYQILMFKLDAFGNSLLHRQKMKVFAPTRENPRDPKVQQNRQDYEQTRKDNEEVKKKINEAEAKPSK